MIYLDAYCLIALARNEVAADEVERLIRRGQTAITTVNLFEVVDFLIRRAGMSVDDARTQLSELTADVIQVTPVTAEVAWRGALLRARHYVSSTSELSLADCILLGSPDPDDALATSDPALAVAAREERIDVVALPDSSGMRP